MKTMQAALESAGLTGVSVAQVADLVNQVYDSVEAESSQAEQRKSNAKEETVTNSNRQFVLTNPDGPASRRQRMYIAALTKRVNGVGIYITDSLTRAEASAIIEKLNVKLGVTSKPAQPKSTSRADVEAMLK